MEDLVRLESSEVVKNVNHRILNYRLACFLWPRKYHNRCYCNSPVKLSR